MTEIYLKNITKDWPGVRAVDDVSFSVPAGTLTALLGPSGCGKSTILRMISGLEDVTSGSILIDGEDVTRVDAAKRGISMVFQSYALFPHLTVKENILFGLKVRKVKKAIRLTRLKEAAGLVGLADLLDRKPAQLSGGQRQRVALARTIVSRQPVCLMDEPLSNLDAKLRAEMRDEIRGLQQKLGLTVLYVTHDQTEAMTMADQVILLCNGKVEQTGTPQDLYREPATVYVAEFIGNPPMNIFQPKALGLKHFKENANCHYLGIRPEDIEVADTGLKVRVEKVDFHGSETILHLYGDQSRIVSKVSGRCELKSGVEVLVDWQPCAVHQFDKERMRLGQ